MARCPAVLALVLLAACGPPGPDLAVHDAWSRPTASGVADGEREPAPTAPGVVYLTVVNRGRTADRLLRVRSDVCATAEIHETRVEADRARMVHLEEGVEIPARGTLAFRPGGHHLMLIGLTRPLRVGQTFEIALEFEHSGTIVVTAEVRSS